MSRQSARDRRGHELGLRLRKARERLGLTQQQVANLVGIGSESVSRAEAGQAPRHSTLMRYLEFFPGLSAHALLLRPPTTAPVAWPSAWNAFRVCFGVAAEAAVYAVHVRHGSLRTEVRTTGVHATEADGKDSSIRRMLMGAAFVGERRVARSLAPDENAVRSGRQAFEDETGRHEFLFRSDGAIDYRADLEGTPFSALRADTEGELEDPLSVQREHDLPVAELRLVLPPVDGAEAQALDERPRPSLRIWPNCTPASEPDIAAQLYPRGLDYELDDAGGCSVSLLKPLPGLRHELSWRAPEDDESSLARVLPGPWSLASTVRGARVEEGLTTRELASRMDVSPGTVSHAEAGRDARYTTLCNLADAVESLSPQDLLPASLAALDLTPAELWSYCRQVVGFEAAEIEKAIFIDVDGNGCNEITTKGLKSLRNDGRELLIRHGMQRSVMNETRDVLLSKLEADDDVGLRVLKARDALARHELRFPKRIGQTGFDYKRVMEKRDLYYLTGTALGKATGGSGPFLEGMAMPIQFPVKKLLMKVVFPQGYSPTKVEAFARPSFVTPQPGLSALSSLAPCPPALLRKRSNVTTLTFKVDRPLIGTAYTLFWGIPDDYEPLSPPRGGRRPARHGVRRGGPKGE